MECAYKALDAVLRTKHKANMKTVDFVYFDINESTPEGKKNYWFIGLKKKDGFELFEANDVADVFDNTKKKLKKLGYSDDIVTNLIRYI